MTQLIQIWESTYKAIKSNNLLLHITWMNFKDITLSKNKHSRMCVCVSLCVCMHVYIYLSMYLNTYLFNYLSIYQEIKPT